MARTPEARAASPGPARRFMVAARTGGAAPRSDGRRRKPQDDFPTDCVDEAGRRRRPRTPSVGLPPTKRAKALEAATGCLPRFLRDPEMAGTWLPVLVRALAFPPENCSLRALAFPPESCSASVAPPRLLPPFRGKMSSSVETPAEKPAGEFERVDMTALTGLRGLLALWVCGFHTVGYSQLQWDLQGSPVMPPFFILSGFCLAVCYGGRGVRDVVPCCGEWRTPWARGFYVNRFAASRKSTTRDGGLDPFDLPRYSSGYQQGRGGDVVSFDPERLWRTDVDLHGLDLRPRLDRRRSRSSTSSSQGCSRSYNVHPSPLGASGGRRPGSRLACRVRLPAAAPRTRPPNAPPRARSSRGHAHGALLDRAVRRRGRHCCRPRLARRPSGPRRRGRRRACPSSSWGATAASCARRRRRSAGFRGGVGAQKPIAPTSPRPTSWFTSSPSPRAPSSSATPGGRAGGSSSGSSATTLIYQLTLEKERGSYARDSSEAAPSSGSARSPRPLPRHLPLRNYVAYGLRGSRGASPTTTRTTTTLSAGTTSSSAPRGPSPT